jgi:hydroxymethylpyrimidine pyrophosphatase-like HAD family hydrolase
VLVEREIYYHDRASYIAHEAWNRHCAADHAELFIRVRPHLPELVGWVNGHFTATVYEDPWSPFCLIAGNNADADAIHARMEDLCRTVPQLTVVRNDVYARFAHSSYDKGKGLAEIARRWNIATDNIFAAGDHLNDLPMLDPQYARWLATPANGIACVKERVRQHGGFVSRRYEGNGIADALEAILYAPPAPPA